MNVKSRATQVVTQIFVGEQKRLGFYPLNLVHIAYKNCVFERRQYDSVWAERGGYMQQRHVTFVQKTSGIFSFIEGGNNFRLFL